MSVLFGELVSVSRLLVFVEEVVGVCVDLGTNLQLEADSGPFSLPDHLDIAAVDAAQSDVAIPQVDRKANRPGSRRLLVRECGLEDFRTCRVGGDETLEEEDTLILRKVRQAFQNVLNQEEASHLPLVVQPQYLPP